MKNSNPMNTKMPKGAKSLAAAEKFMGGNKGMEALQGSPAFRKQKGKSSDRIGAGKLHRGMKSPV